MSISDLHHPGTTPAALLAEAVASVREAAEAFFAAQSDSDLVATIELASQLRSVTARETANPWSSVPTRRPDR
jgi:hypothetical protein